MMRRGYVLLGLLLVAGCSDPSATTNEDAHFLRDITGTNPTTPVDLKRLMPTDPKAKWTNAFQSSVSPTVRGEVTRYVGMRSLRGRPCAVFETANDRGVTYRSEWYEYRPSGVYLAQAGGSESIVLEPPFLVLPNPLERERTHAWSGTMTFRGVRLPARGLTRYRDQQTLTLKIGTVDTARVETVLMAMVEGRTVRFPTIRWFARDYGIVRSWFQVDQTTFQRDMHTWSGPAPREKTVSGTGENR